MDGLGHEEQLESAGIEAPKDDERHFHRGMTEAEIIARLERDANRPSPGELQLDLVEDSLTDAQRGELADHQQKLKEYLPALL